MAALFLYCGVEFPDGSAYQGSMGVSHYQAVRSRPIIGTRWTRVVDVFGKLWASPYTLLGAGYGLLCYLPCKLLDAQPQIRFGHNAIQFIGSGILKRRALTLGNVILYGREAQPERCGAYGDPCVSLGRHEQAHTYQYQLLGPFFAPVYCLSGGCSGPGNNIFERAAQNFALGTGSWWPALGAARLQAIKAADR